MRSRPNNLAPGVEMMLFRSILTVSKSVVGVPTSPLKLILLQLAVSHVPFTSNVWGRSLHIILQFMMSFHLSLGTSLWWMKWMVSVALFLPDIPWARRPNSFPIDYCYGSLYFGFLIRCWYLGRLPMFLSSAASAKFVKNSSGHCRPASWRAVTVTPM